MKRNLLKFAVLSTLAGAPLAPAVAQDSGPLIDKLVQKGILNDQEAEDLRADLVKDFNQTSAGKLNISNSITELKLYGDARYRYQYDDAQSQVASTSHVTQRSRNRFRLRLYADFKFTDHFFGGVGLETGNANDSGNQTVDPIFSDSNIYISRVFLGYNAGDWGTFIVGKQKNPFFTASSELVWDQDVNPFGVTEAIAFDKLFAYDETVAPTTQGYSKDGKSVATYTGATTSHGFDWGNFQLSLIAGQFVYTTDNTTISSANEAEFDSDASNDVYMFEEQLVASYNFDSKTAITVAPAFIAYNAGDLAAIGSLNTEGFGDTIVAPKGSSIPNSGVVPPVSGESRNLAIVDLPFEFKFPVGDFSARIYGEAAYNLSGEDRYTNSYGLGYTVTKLNGAGTDVLRSASGAPIQYDPVSGSAVSSTYIPRQHDDRDDLAWLVGFEFGKGKGKGSWSISTNYRESGISSVDPNLNDSDFAQSRLNTRGFKSTATYFVTDFLSLAVTAQIAYNLDDDLFGGQATNGTKLADQNASNIYQFDVNWKF